MKWSPIETAPRDGTPFLGYSSRARVARNKIVVVVWTEWDSEAYGQQGRFALAWNVYVGAPALTHWMPFPEPPKDNPQVQRTRKKSAEQSLST